jgi:hypothetical protein
MAILAGVKEGEVVDVNVSGPMMLPREKELYSVVSGQVLRLKMFQKIWVIDTQRWVRWEPTGGVYFTWEP